MIPVAEALATVLREAQPAAPVVAALEHALGLVSAAPITAADPLPPFPASIKDGYAVFAADGAGIFPLAGSVTAGRVADFVLQPGQVAYITTGAPLPPGANAVVQVEDTERLSGDHGAVHVRIGRAATVGQDVRPLGYDVAQGACVVETGVLLGPAEIGLAATVGVGQLSVYPRPRVGVLSTGDELVRVGNALGAGSIRDSNGPMLRAAVERAGGDPIDLGIARDADDALQEAFARAMVGCDILVTTGGVSMGELDLMRGLVEKAGTVHFGRLLLKPGKPCTFATVQHRGARRLVFGLPGNPVSSLVTFYLLVLPAIQSMAGRRNPGLRRVHAHLAAPLRLDPARPEYHRAHVQWVPSLASGAGGWLATSTGNQASSRLLSMYGANALLELPQADGELPAGASVPALLIE
jgi:gephyrin